MEVFCLDDSALKRDIVLQPETSYEDAKRLDVLDIDKAL